MPDDVLIIHNSVEQAAAGKGGYAFSESNAGLMEEVRAVVEAIEKLGIKCHISSIERLDQLPEVLSDNEQKIIFNLVEELPANILDACYVPSICYAYGRACTGNGTAALMLAQNKWQAKAILEAAGVPSPKSAVAAVGDKIQAGKLPKGKYIVKPVFSDASEGIDADSIVDFPGRALTAAIDRIHNNFNQPAIVEQFIPDRELNVSVIERNGQVEVLPIAEIDFSAFSANSHRIVDYSAKWHSDSFAYNNTPRILPAALSEEAAGLVRQYAIAAWKAVGCQDYARVDFRMDDKERPFVIEINPNPDISADAGFAAAINAAGISYEQFVESMLENAKKRLGRI